MGRGPRRLVGTLAVLLGLAGCTHPGHVSNSPSSCGDNSLPTIARGSVEANLRSSCPTRRSPTVGPYWICRRHPSIAL